VVLLIVISLLMLFSLVAVTFAIVAGQFKHAAVASAKAELVGDPPKKDLDTVMYALLRDTTSRTSIQGHSLLKDLYDTNDGTIGQVAGAAITAGGSFTRINSNSTSLALTDHAYNGCVITFTTGAAKGFSSRVVGYTAPAAAGGLGSILIESTDGENTLLPTPSVGDFFLINGRAFNGTGFGYDPNPGAGKIPGIELMDTTNGGASLDANGNPPPVALLPHFAGYQFPTTQPVDQGGADESWDAPDLNNMILAMVPAAARTSSEILPSFHRPDLIGFWFKWLRGNALQNLSTTDAANAFRFPFGVDGVPGSGDEQIPNSVAQQIVSLKRQFIFRPLAEDHPNFTGSNPGFDVLMGAQLNAPDIHGVWPLPNPLPPDARIDMYDVDNDNDGVPDSVWIDPGLPLVTSPNGRQYKKLVAVLVKDLDGRINLNTAEGTRDANRIANFWQARANTSQLQQFTLSNYLTSAPAKPLPFQGQGYGPAELMFAHLFSSIGFDPTNVSPANISEFTSLLTGRYASNFTANQIPIDNRPGLPGIDDFASAVKNLWFPPVTSNNQYFSNYRSSVDPYGVRMIFLDLDGRPGTIQSPDVTDVPLGQLAANAYENVDDPYEINPVVHRNDDRWYVAAELERLLRWNDVDATALPDRLRRLAPTLFSDPQVRNLVTTHSMHLPVPKTVLPPELRAASSTLVPLNYKNRPLSIVDLYRLKLAANLPASQIDAELDKILPFEMRHGQLFNVNRVFGNGRDDRVNAVSGNGVVDDINEATNLASPERIWPAADNTTYPPTVGHFATNIPTFPATATFGDYRNDVPLPPGAASLPAGVVRDPRLIFARHLYCLAWLLVDYNYQQPPLGNKNLTPAEQQQLTARQLAQWAVNVVDFRDPDAANTGFEYAVNPFQGWNVDGNVATANPGEGLRGVVWGVEAPELIITETFATHNRGVRDTDYEAPNAKKRATNNNQTDDDLDQFRQPQGSLFVELHCVSAANGNSMAAAPELSNFGTYKLDLGRMAPARSIGNANLAHPVWRIVVTKTLAKDQAISDLNRKINDPYVYNFDPRAPIDRLVSNAPGNITHQATERIIWFAPQDPTGYPEQNQVFYGRSGQFVNPLPVIVSNQTFSNLELTPGSYAVIGPRPQTSFGSLKLGTDGDAMTYEPVPEQISLNPTTLAIGFGGAYGNGYPPVEGNGPPVPNQIRIPRGLICAAKPPAGWTNTARQIGINVSEPLPQSGQYYAEPNPTNDGRLPFDAYADITQGFDPVANFVPDAPFDDQLNIIGGGTGNNGSDVSTRTIIAHRSLFLQRLANPLLPWNPDPTDPEMSGFWDASLMVNPYLTVDFSDVDLHVFSGEEDTTQTVMINNQPEPIDPSDPDTSLDKFDKDNGFIYATRERGAVLGGNTPVATSPQNTLLFPPWTARRDNANQIAGMGDYNFPQRVFPHTLGYLNWMISPTLNMPVQAYVGALPINSPHRFPWFTMSNRPFANPYELLLVPGSAPSRLLAEFSQYSVPQNNNGPPQARGMYLEVAEGYQHLLNFFHAFQGSAPATQGQPGASQQLVRLFDFIETPSPYAGAERWYPATAFFNQPDAKTFRPPFNYLSRFRDPGRININTISDPREFQALTAMFQHYNNINGSPSLFDRFVESRRGYSANEYNDYPTIFANPVRTAMSADLMPDVRQMRKRNAVEATLLRPDPLTLNGNQPQPLFDFFNMDPDQPSDPANDLAFETHRNPYFRYRGLARLSNLVSTNSNVYAMWLTMGYFEVEPHGVVDAGHPDGMRLGREIGLDVGTAERHRAFYLIDRSVPVGFQQGFDHNVDRAIMVRRFLE
jgi:hypothetical protein